MTRHSLVRLFVLLSLGLAAFGVRAADPPGERDRAAIRGVIESQIAAFRRDDGAAAFAFAAPSIQQMFGTVDNFMAMVRGGYRAVYRPQSFRFGDVVMIEDAIVQKVHVVGPDGQPVTAFYIMEKQPDGTWRIAGCSLGAPEEQSA